MNNRGKATLQMWGAAAVRGAAALIFSVLLPAAAWAQSGMVGVVKDTSGSVMPGVTVEATSPALIEGMRSTVTDPAGAFKLIDLRPGVYVVTFSLAGFETVRREAIELPAGFTATVNAELKVGTIQEMVTVSGAVPVVDVQTSATQVQMSNQTLESIPVPTRQPSAFVNYIPGVTGSSLSGVGNNVLTLAIHGGLVSESDVTIDGFTDRSAQGPGGVSPQYYVNESYVREISVRTGGGPAEQQLGGILTNAVPKEGGNSMSGFLFGGYSGSGMQGNNLPGTGLASVNTIQTVYDITPSLGGAIVKDKLWYYLDFRNSTVRETVANQFVNANLGGWTVVPILSQPGLVRIDDSNAGGRLTLQANQKNKVSFWYDWAAHTQYDRNYNAVPPPSPEAETYTPVKPDRLSTFIWKSTPTNQILIDAGVGYFGSDYSPRPVNGSIPGIVSATEQTTGVSVRSSTGIGGYGHNINHVWNFRGSSTFVSNSHSIKVGAQVIFGSFTTIVYPNGDMNIRTNTGIPNQITLFASQYKNIDQYRPDGGIFAQDSWQMKRLTLNYGLRYDWFVGTVPAQSMIGGLFVGPSTWPAVSGAPSWKDLSPRVAAAYDVFGDGKTAFKASLSRYVVGASTSQTDLSNPFKQSVLSTTRSWKPSAAEIASNTFVPSLDCVLTNPLANGECGQDSNVAFGQPNVNATTYDPNALTGYDKRPYNWEVATSLQHELRPGLSVSAAYTRRWFGNFTVLANQLTTPADYSPFCVNVPAEGSNAGGNTCGFFDVSPAKFGLVKNLITEASNYGNETQVYNGFDLTTQARLSNGFQIQGGVSTGRTELNTCFIVNSGQDLLYCDQKPPFQPNAKFSVIYKLPWWDLVTSAIWQSIPGTAITASYVVNNAQVSPSLGRTISAGAAGTITLPTLLNPAASFEPRQNQTDFRIGKVFNYGKANIKGTLDVFNIFNANTTQTLNTTYGPVFGQPTIIQLARSLKVSATLTF